MRRRTDRGVTMLELLVVLFVIGALWAVAYPTIRSVQERPPVPTAPAPLLAAVTADGTPPAAGPDGPNGPHSEERCYLLRMGTGGGTTTPVPCP